MRLALLTVALCVGLAAGEPQQRGTARRVRVRPVQLDYYAEQEEDSGPVLLSRQDNYGRATGEARASQAKVKDVGPRAPPVQTIRNYNKLNDDGSFTFGYEAADGSFKEETRGTDCVVRGKYGYIDPDGNKREFTYVSGNPCDPNAIEPEEEPLPDSGEENIPANIPIRRPRPQPQAQPQPVRKPLRPATTLFQQDYNSRPSSSEEDEDDDEISRPIPVPVRPVTRPPSLRPSPTLADLERELRPRVQAVQASPRPQAVSITPRPQTLPATTYRPTVSTTPTPHYVKSRPTTQASFEQELKSFQLENNLVTTPRPRPSNGAGHPVYTTELVFDPNSGQYNTVVYQTLPQTNSDLNLRLRQQPFVPSPQYVRTPYSGAPPQRPAYQQQLFQSQQSNLVQQSSQLYRAQQERKNLTPKDLPPSLLQQEPHRFTPSPKSYAPPPPPPPPSHPQSFYYLNPSERVSLSNGQIDAFLRGHNY